MSPLDYPGFSESVPVGRISRHKNKKTFPQGEEMNNTSGTGALARPGSLPAAEPTVLRRTIGQQLQCASRPRLLRLFLPHALNIGNGICALHSAACPDKPTGRWHTVPSSPFITAGLFREPGQEQHMRVLSSRSCSAWVNHWRASVLPSF